MLGDAGHSVLFYGMRRGRAGAVADVVDRVVVPWLRFDHAISVRGARSKAEHVKLWNYGARRIILNDPLRFVVQDCVLFLFLRACHHPSSVSFVGNRCCGRLRARDVHSFHQEDIRVLEG